MLVMCVQKTRACEVYLYRGVVATRCTLRFVYTTVCFFKEKDVQKTTLWCTCAYSF